MTKKTADRFRPDKGFQGTDGNAARSGPVQFEKDNAVCSLSWLWLTAGFRSGRLPDGCEGGSQEADS